MLRVISLIVPMAVLILAAARNRADAIRYKTQLQKLAKVVVFVSQGIISGNDNDFLNEGINEVLDEHYSRNLSRWVRGGLRVKASQGYSLGSPPLGYRHEPRSEGRGVRMVPNEKTMPALMALLKGYATGKHSFSTLAQSLNAQGFRTSAGKPFTESSISTALNNPFYFGKLVYHRNQPDEEVIEGAHEVPSEVSMLWRRCQEVRQEKQISGQPSPLSRKHNVFPLTGILRCDGCGEPFHGVTNRQKGKAYRRMLHSFRSCAMRPLSLSAARIEDEFAERVLPYLTLDDGWRTAVLQALSQEGPKPDRNIELKRVESALANLRKQHLWGAIPDEEFKREFQALEGQRKTLASNPTRDVTPNLERAAEQLRNLPALWHHPGVALEQRRDLAREVFEELRLKEGELVAVRPRPDYASYSLTACGETTL